MKQKHVLLSGFSLVIIIWLLVSCQWETEPIVTTSSVELTRETMSPQPSLEFTTPLSHSIATVPGGIETASVPNLNPTSSPTPVQVIVTPLPTLVPSTVALATLTPLPTLEGEELKAVIEELLVNPMDCDVPCWWGAIPGVTNISEIEHAISPYASDIFKYNDEEGNVYIRLGIKYIEVRNDFEIVIVYRFSNLILSGVTAISPQISEVLTRYGLPDEVWLSGMTDPRGPSISMNMLYFKAGMGVHYTIDSNFQDDNKLMGCFASKETGILRLVTPNSVTDYKALSPNFEQDRRYLPLEQATNLTMDEFMERFSDPTQPLCIETPAELWE
jgi:hypothetical protein